MPPSRSHRSSTWCRRVWDYQRRGLTSTAQCPRSLLLSPYYFYALSISSLVARLIRPSWFRGLGIHETRQHHSQAAKSILRGADVRTSNPSVFVPLLAHFSFSLSSRPSVPPYLSLRHIWADSQWSSRWARSSICPSTSTTWTMTRHVDARRR